MLAASLHGAPLDPQVLSGSLEDSRVPGTGPGPCSLGSWVRVATPSLVNRREDVDSASFVKDNAHSQLALVDARLDDVPELCSSLGEPAGAVSNAELVLKAFRQWNVGCVDRILGDFSFVICDGENRSLVAARDALGVKHLYYAQAGDILFLASRIESILALERVPRRLEESALLSYLADRGSAPDETMFRKVRRLPAGCLLQVRGGNIHHIRYWPRDDGYPPPGCDREEFAPELRRVLVRAVERRLGDERCTVGLTLSGGLDSSAVAAIASEVAGSRRLLAYSYSFETLQSCDELSYAEAAADHLSMDLRLVDAERHHLLASPSSLEAVAASPFLGWRSTDDAILQDLSGEGGRTLLTGIGGDHLFQGSIGVFASGVLQGNAEAFRKVFAMGRRHGLSPPRSLYRYLFRPLLPVPVDAAFRRFFGHSSPRSLHPWLSKRFARRWGRKDGAPEPEAAPWRDPAQRAIRATLRNLDTLERTCSWKAQRAAAVGVKVHHPFLDRELAELALSVDPSWHYFGGLRKQLLRDALGSDLPEVVLKRPGKTTFSDFIDFSLRQPSYPPLRELLEFSALVELGAVDLGDLKPRLKRFFSGGEKGFGASLWYLLSAERWLRSFWGLEASEQEGP